MAKKVVNIYTIKNGVGLERDANLAADLLRGQGCKVKIVDIVNVPRRELADIQIFMEKSDYNYLNLADTNYIVPNPEWYYSSWLKHLKKYDKVLCKTRDCKRIFDKYTPKTVFTSFTSEDRKLAGVEKKKKFFHNAGGSAHKGTHEIFHLYKKKGAKLPEVTIIKHGGRLTNHNMPGMKYIHGRLPEDEFKKAQNEFMFHLCPSYYEGFGHYINEARSCGAVIITTNAAPMNEFVENNKSGLLVKVKDTRPWGQARFYHVNMADLENKIKKLLNLTDDKLAEMSGRAREAFEENDKFFRRRFLEEILG